MKILVTGAAGRMGHVISAHLQQQGHQIRGIDVVDESELNAYTKLSLENAEYRQVDMRDFEAVAASCEGQDAIVHLAGIPFYEDKLSLDIFHVNAGGTFNLYQGAMKAGIKRVIAASSINFLGNGFGPKMIDIEYFPVDEAHPNYTMDVYAFSKHMVEEVAAYFWRLAGISSICFRFPMIYNRYWLTDELTLKMWERNQADFKRFMELPEDERKAATQKILERYMLLRNQRTSGEIDYMPLWQFFMNEPGGMLMFGVENFWSVLHVQDSAKVVELALAADFEGSIPLFVGEVNNSTELPSRELAALFYPSVQEWKRPLTGAESLLSIEKANDLLGFTPTIAINEGHLS